MTYALGRGVGPEDMPSIRRILRNASANDDRFSSLVLGIVKSVPFQMRIKPAQEEPVPSSTSTAQGTALNTEAPKSAP
jgi:hypothetical protein